MQQQDGLRTAEHLMRMALALLDRAGADIAAAHLQLALDLIDDGRPASASRDQSDGEHQPPMG